MYSWLDENEIVSCLFKNFNKRYSVYREGLYKGIVWEYPWLSMLLDYENMEDILVIGTERFYQIFKKQHPALNVLYESKIYDVEEKRQFDAIICEDLCGSQKRLSVDIEDVITYLKPLGKLVTTYRYSIECPNLEVLNKLMETSLMPYSYQECDILPNDPKFSSLYQEYKERLKKSEFVNCEKTSIGLVLYKPMRICDLERRKFYLNVLWLDSQNQVIEYMDNKAKVNNMCFGTDKLYRIFYLPKKLIQANGIDFEEFCGCYNVTREIGCTLMNDLLVNDLFI